MVRTALAAFAICLSMAAPCIAHATLQSSLPADSARLTEAPKSLTLTFSEAAQLAILKLVINGREIPIAVDKSAQASRSFTLALPELAKGQYTVQWTAVAAADGHVSKGFFAFSIAL
jgi:methionine-rich copper-binding protein CopC